MPQDLKDRVRARAAADGISETAAAATALEMWLNADKRPSAESEGRG